MSKSKRNAAYELITADDAATARERLERNRLTQKWLIFRLDRDWGIRVKKSQLSEILDGKRALGPKTQKLIWCCLRILYENDRFYKGR